MPINVYILRYFMCLQVCCMFLYCEHQGFVMYSQYVVVSSITTAGGTNEINVLYFFFKTCLRVDVIILMLCC